MKKLFILLTVAIAALSMSAAPVDQTMAQKKAQAFLSQGVSAGRFMASGVLNPGLKLAEVSRVTGANAVYYIFTTSDSYVVVAGDDRAETILAYGDYCLDINNIPPGLQDMLNQYRDAIEFLQKNPGLKVDPAPSPQNNPKLRATSVEPLLTCNWDQEAPYWNRCLINGYQCVTGCPATSAAMVFYYWKYPTDPTPVVPAYQCELSYSYWSSQTVNLPALPSVTFDWDNMLDNYTDGYSTEQGDAVATLMRYIGQAEHMKYGTEASGVSSDSVKNICKAFLFFGYDPETTRTVRKTSDYSGGQTLYTDDEWAAFLQEEIFAERPIVFCAIDSYGNGGHAFNVDGYDSTNNTYHINFGWSGAGNDWCALNAFSVPGYYNFNVYQQMVIGIQPPAQGPAIKPNRSKLSIEGFVDQSSSGTFVVKGHELTDAITLTLNDESGYFAIDANSVALGEQEAGKTITVIYSPLATGEHSATITLSSPGVDDKVVTINGVATLDTYKPVMLPADETYINLTKFRADWTDQTADKYVDNYTLEVSTQPFVTLLSTLDGSPYPGGYESITLTAPWSGSDVKVGNSAYYFSNYSGDGYMAYTVPDGYTNDVFTMQITTISGNYGIGNLTVGSDQTANVGHNFSGGETYNWLVTASTGDMIIITTTDNYYSPDMTLIKVYAGDANERNTLKAEEEGNANYRLITGITDKFYTVKDLAEAGTFYFRVKATYTDGTRGSWSNAQTVTLFENGHDYELGDVNHDGNFTIGDVTMLISYVLANGNGAACPICADVNEDGTCNIADVTMLIAKVLRGN